MQGINEWLLDSDPAIRWQVMDLSHAPEGLVSAERSRVASEGWGAELLAQQTPNGGWSDIERPREFIETPDGAALYALVLLRDMGLDPESEPARRAVTLIREKLTHTNAGQPFFEGEVETCVNGMVLNVGAYFGEENEKLADGILASQLEDGGWNCDAPESQRSSFHSTICVLEGLLEYEKANGANDEVTEARGRAHEYLLERGMLRSRSTGQVINPDWTLFSYPAGWHYDVLRGLDYLRAADVEPDERIGEAVEVVRRQRGDDGRWPLQNPDPEQVDFDMGEREGEPSRWNTLRALRVLEWAGRSAG